jgi:hypothetical protein
MLPLLLAELPPGQVLDASAGTAGGAVEGGWALP